MDQSTISLLLPLIPSPLPLSMGTSPPLPVTRCQGRLPPPPVHPRAATGGRGSVGAGRRARRGGVRVHRGHPSARHYYKKGFTANFLKQLRGGHNFQPPWLMVSISRGDHFLLTEAIIFLLKTTSQN